MYYNELESFAATLLIFGIGVGVITGGLLLVGAGDGIVGGIISASSNMKEDTVKIEQNVQQGAGYASFDAKAYGVAEEDGHYYAEVMGEAIIVEGSDPVFTSLTYEIDSELYSSIKSTFTIKYSLEADNSITGIYSNHKSFFYTTYVEEKKDILEQLAEVTKQKIINKKVYTNSAEVVDTAIEYMGEETKVTALGSVKVDEVNGIAWFNLDIARKTENNAISIKRFVITVPLSHEIVENPTKAYDFYAKNPDKCTVDAIENGKSVICQGTNKNGDRVLGIVDDELVL